MILLPEQVPQAAAAIIRGEIVAYPTETYYGFAVDALNPAALARLFALKGRVVSKVSALLVVDFAMLAALCLDVPERARQLARAHWPGPLTLALPARPHLPSAIVSEGCVAARVSSHALAHALVAEVGRPITATSANPSVCPPVASPAELASLFPAGGFHILDGGSAPGGAPSTLVRVRGDRVEILRQGSVAVG